jgi:phage shock protein A
MTEEHEQIHDDHEREADDLERQGDKLEKQIKETRQDWEAKKADESVPGAREEPENDL